MKYQGSYDSVIGGVSEQTPENRRSGQHYEQVNMISDPVRGLVRRHGSVRVSEQKLFRGYLGDAEKEATRLDSMNYKSVDFVVGDNRYSLMYRTKEKVAGSVLQPFICLNKETGDLLIIDRNPDDEALDNVEEFGVSASTAVGRYAFLAGNNLPVEFDLDTPWVDDANQKLAAAWVKQGGYSRKFTLTLTMKEIATSTKTTFSVEYTTKAASYPGLLDTTSIPFSDPEYQKKINDATNEYNGLVTQWIGLAAADIVATNIATQLRDLLQALITAHTDPTIATLELSGSTIGIKAGTAYVVDNLTLSDNGDGTLAVALAQTTKAADSLNLTAEHYVGKIVKVVPKKNDDSDGYYLKAVPRDPNFTGTGLTEVEWKEAAGEVVTPTQMFIYATVDTNVLYIASTAAKLAAIAPSIDEDDVPTYKSSVVGDGVTSPIPYFFGKRITYLGVFQDRLVVGCGSVISFSRNGDYFNFFRQSVLTIEDDDPIEVFSLGKEDDIIRSGTFYDKNLVLFGDRRQYAISGRSTLVPSNAVVSVLSQHEDATEADAQGSGNFVFYAKSKDNFTSLHQLQLGAVADSPESFEVSQQISKYIVGRPIQILPVTTPNHVILRTTDVRNGFYVYSYLDSPGGQERLFDAWSRWEWNPVCGFVVGIALNNGQLWVTTIRHGKSPFEGYEDGDWHLVVDSFTFDTSLSELPYLDSLVRYDDVIDTPFYFLNPVSEFTSEFSCAFDNTAQEFMLGQSFDSRANLEEAYDTSLITSSLWVGVNFNAYVTPTNPYIKDKNDKSIVNGRLTVTRYTVSVSETGGIVADLETKSRGTYTVGRWNARTIGRLSAELGVQPIVDGVVNVPVGRSNVEFRYSLKSMDWLPVRITSIEWTGQFFYNSRRA